MREFMLGMLAVGLVAGVAVGRVTERARRGYKDYGAAKTALQTGRKTAFAAGRKMITTVAVASLILVAIFIGAMNLPH